VVRETVGGEPYEYYPLGEHVVSAPGVCDGEPTFKYTRISVQHAMELLSGGWTVEQVARSYRVPAAGRAGSADPGHASVDPRSGVIVLDEHLQGLGVEEAVGRWFRPLP
jgi:uncharacterized protein (DUF433 family)